MGRIQTSIGLITGTDIAGTVDKLMAINAKPKDRLSAATKDLQSQQTAVNELTALVIGVQFAGRAISATPQYQARSATSGNENALTATATTSAQLGTIKAKVTQLASTNSFQTKGLTSDVTAALGLTGEISVRAGGFVNSSVPLANLNQGRGVASGSIRITDRSGKTEDIDLSKASSIDDVINTINNASTVRVKATTSGDSIQLTDISGATTGNLKVGEVGGGETAADLGLAGLNVAANVGTGTDIYGVITDTAPTGLQGVPLANLGGGNGLGTLTSIKITTTNGANGTIDLSSARTTQDVIRLINASGLPVEAKLTESSTGFRIRDLSGGSTNGFSISSTDDTAKNLGINQQSTSRVIDGQDLYGQFVTRDSRLAWLRQGRGVDAGSIRLTNAAGASANIDLSDSAKITVGTLINRINASGLSVTASINAKGDGIKLVDNSGGTGRLTVADINGDTTAADLGLSGTSDTGTSGSQDRLTIESRQADVIKVNAGDTLKDIVDRINSQGRFATASIATADDGSKSIALRSARGGEQGRLSIASTGIDLGIRTTSAGRDAVLEVEGEDGSKRQLKSGDGVFAEVVPGVSITAKQVTTDPVTVTVAQDTSTVVTNVKAFVTQYNKLVDKLSALTAYNSDTNETGLLFGSAEALRTESSYTRVLSGQVFGAGKIKGVSELGLSFNDKGQLELNETKLTDKLKSQSNDVSAFLTTKETGLTARLDVVAERLAGVNKSMLLSRNEALGTRIQRNTEQLNNWTTRLDKQRERLLNQFYSTETAISKLKSNQNALDSIKYLSSSTSN